MRHASLFSGIGGNDLAAKRVGWQNVFQVEIDQYCQQVLALRFPETQKFRDIFEFEGYEFRGKVDIISGGDPCQRNSNANRAGSLSAQSLGDEFLRVVANIKPRWVLRENPATVRKDAPWPAWKFADQLEGLGYVVPAPFKRRACCSGGQHRRERLFVLGFLPDANSERLQRNVSEILEGAVSWRQDTDSSGSNRGNPTPRVCRGADGIPKRVDRLKGIGNSVDVYVMIDIFRLINQIDKMLIR